MDRNTAEVYADLLLGQGLTDLNFQGKVSSNLLLACILRGFQIRRLDSLTEGWYQTEEKYFPVGYGASSGHGLNSNCGGLSPGVGNNGSWTDKLENSGKGISPLFGSGWGDSDNIQKIVFPLFVITENPEIPLTQIAQRRFDLFDRYR